MADDIKYPEEISSSRNLGRDLRLGIAVVLVLITIGLVLDNRGDVRVGWVLGDFTAPLALAIVVAFVLGIVVGWLGSLGRRS